MRKQSVPSAVVVGAMWCALAALAGCAPAQQVERVGAGVTQRSEPLVWAEAQKLQASDGGVEYRFGASVAISGDHAIVGSVTTDAPPEGKAYVFERQADGTWLELQTLNASDGAAGYSFGYSVAIAGNVAVVGVPFGGDEGAAYMYERQADGSWLELQKLSTPGNPSDVVAFGWALALSDGLLVVGAPGTHASHEATAFVFEPPSDGAAWSHTATLAASDLSPSAYFGRSVAVDGDLVLVGAPDDLAAEEAGAAYLFRRDGVGSWTEVRKLPEQQPPPCEIEYSFGSSVALAGDDAVIGDVSAAMSSQYGVGVAHVFSWHDGGSSHTCLAVSAADSSHGFGASVALIGDLVAVGAPASDPDERAVYLFERVPPLTGSWSERQRLVPSDVEVAHGFGSSLALSDPALIVGTPMDDGVGAAYRFELRGEIGEPCPGDHECLSGHCVDGVCCESGCGDGDTGDCQACSVASGSTTDGSCEPLADGAACAGGACSDGSCTDIELGFSCSSDDQCASEHCVDDVCCAEASCAPYRCQAISGLCNGLCQSDPDCVEGFHCTSTGQCQPDQDVDVDEGCGCRAAAPRFGGRWVALALCGLALVQRRRRGAQGTAA